nr:MAG TPA: hypothetical protein [Caudoviricetes sp.]
MAFSTRTRLRVISVDSEVDVLRILGEAGRVAGASRSLNFRRLHKIVLRNVNLFANASAVLLKLIGSQIASFGGGQLGDGVFGSGGDGHHKTGGRQGCSIASCRVKLDANRGNGRRTGNFNTTIGDSTNRTNLRRSKRACAIDGSLGGIIRFLTKNIGGGTSLIIGGRFGVSRRLQTGDSNFGAVELNSTIGRASFKNTCGDGDGVANVSPCGYALFVGLKLELARIGRINNNLILRVGILNLTGNISIKTRDFISGIGRLSSRLRPIVDVGSKTADELKFAVLLGAITNLHDDGGNLFNLVLLCGDGSNRNFTNQKYGVVSNPICITVVLQGNACVKIFSSHIILPPLDGSTATVPNDGVRTLFKLISGNGINRHNAISTNSNFVDFSRTLNNAKKCVGCDRNIDTLAGDSKRRTIDGNAFKLGVQRIGKTSNLILRDSSNRQFLGFAKGEFVANSVNRVDLRTSRKRVQLFKKRGGEVVGGKPLAGFLINLASKRVGKTSHLILCNSNNGKFLRFADSQFARSDRRDVIDLRTSFDTGKLSAFGVGHQAGTIDLIDLATQTSSNFGLGSIGLRDFVRGGIVAKVNHARKDVILIILTDKNNSNIGASGIRLARAFNEAIGRGERISHIVDVAKRGGRSGGKVGKRGAASGLIDGRNSSANLIVCLLLGVDVGAIRLIGKCAVDSRDVALNSSHLFIQGGNLLGVLTNGLAQTFNGGSIGSIPFDGSISLLTGLLIFGRIGKTNNGECARTVLCNRLVVANGNCASSLQRLVGLNDIQVGRIGGNNNNLLTVIIDRSRTAGNVRSSSGGNGGFVVVEIRIILNRKCRSHCKRHAKVKLGQIRNSHYLCPPFLK